jgi:hypothetical protein
MQTKIDNTIAYEKWKLIGANLATFICKGFKSKATELFSGIGGFLEGLFTGNGGISMPDKDKGNYQNWTYKDPITGKTYGPGVKNGQSYADGVKDGVNSKKEDIGDAINQNFKDAKVKTDTTAAEIGQGISDNILAKLETMDASGLKELSTELQNLQTTVQNTATAMATSFTSIQDSSRTSFVGLTNIVRNQMVNCTNIFRNQFINMANIARNQMLNVSNIVRNQSVNWANIIRNQVTNARDALTKQFLSMASVARTQMLNISNIVRNQAVNWANIISNQATNARNNLTRQFISMAKVVATQMKNCLSSVQTYMSRIASATNKPMTINVNRAATVSYAGGAPASALSANALYAANNASTFSLGGNMNALSYGASSAMSSSRSGAGSSNNSNGSITLEIPVVLDGKEVARATAKYVDNELKTINKREDRKRGVR